MHPKYGDLVDFWIKLGYFVYLKPSKFELRSPVRVKTLWGSLDFAEAVDNYGNHLILFYPVVRRKLWGAMGIESFPVILWMDFGGTMTFIRTPPKTWRARRSYPLYKRFPSTGFAGACYYAVEVVSHPYFPVRLVPCLHAVARMKKMSRCSAMYHRRLPWGAPDWFAEA